MLATSAIQGFDVSHQLWRLRHVKQMQDVEVELIMRAMAESVQTYDQVVEVRDRSRRALAGCLFIICLVICARISFWLSCLPMQADCCLSALGCCISRRPSAS